MLADDLGNYEVGFHNPLAITPNIDALASEGKAGHDQDISRAQPAVLRKILFILTILQSSCIALAIALEF